MPRCAVRLSLLIASMISAAACGGSAATTAPAAAPASAAARRPAVRPGADKEHPVPRCGPQDSYAFVASTTCADGSTPLRGDARAGAEARQGNVGENSTGHIIDLYVVDCPEGPVEIFVDMYGCPAYDAQLKAEVQLFGPPGAHLERDQLLAIAALIRKMATVPFDPESVELFPGVIGWLLDSPDVSVKVCPVFESPGAAPGQARMDSRTQIAMYSLLGMAAFQIEHPDADPLSVQVAGIQLALRVYDQWRAAGGDPLPEFEPSRAAEAQGRLREWFTANVNCE